MSYVIPVARDLRKIEKLGDSGMYRFKPEASQVRFWCMHCKCWHYHGASSGIIGSGDGHRHAHCYRPNSPYAKKGYELKEVYGMGLGELKRLARKRGFSHILENDEHIVHVREEDV